MNMASCFIQFTRRWKYSILSVTLFLCTQFLVQSPLLPVFASHCASTDYDCQISEIQREIDALAPANETNKKELTNTRNQVDSLTNRIATLSKQLDQTQKDIANREKDLSHTETVFEAKSVSHYKFIRLYDPLLPFLSSNDAAEIIQRIIFHKSAANSDIQTMNGYGQDLLKLKTDKSTLEKNKTNLALSKDNLSKRATFLASEVEKTEKYLTTLDSKQEALIAAKAAGFATSVGDTPGTAEPCSGPPGSSNFCDPGFRPAFAGFSFGAPHRTGMSQYGAYGRSKSGQNAEAILSAYYQGASLNKSYPVPATIGITGIGRVSFEENYLLGIYEIPESWGNNGGFEALKAQAVAARSYALAQTNNGAGNICTTEACQVYKPQLKSGKWAEAVRATRGWVLTVGGAPAKAYFASTSGGYTISQWGWTGIKDASGDWPTTAYEKVGGSPWFYKGWYKDRSGKSCGKTNPWLTSEQMADIVNAWSVVYKGGADVSRVTPIDTGCWKGNPYSYSELAGIGGYTSVTGVSVIYSNNGSTQSVTLSTNKGSVSIAGEELKKAFNLRAPGYIGIKSSLFNIEKL
jgi:peptidoglycan hydrolase CwlO-like protein